MSLQLTPTTIAYRSSVAAAAGGGTPIAPMAWMAFGSGDTPYSAERDEQLLAEFVRVPLTVTQSGPTLIASAVITGNQAGMNVIREAGVFTSAGILVGRRVLAPKELEAEAELEVGIHFEY